MLLEINMDYLINIANILYLFSYLVRDIYLTEIFIKTDFPVLV